MNEKNVHDAILRAYENIDGPTLVQFCKLKRESSEFFYNQLMQDTKKKIKLSDIAYFVQCLDELEKKYLD